MVQQNLWRRSFRQFLEDQMGQMGPVVLEVRMDQLLRWHRLILEILLIQKDLLDRMDQLRQ